MILKDLERIDTKNYLSTIRMRNEAEHQRRLEEVYSRLPEIKEYDDRIASAAFDEIRSRLNKEDGSADYQNRINELSDRKIELLRRNGYPDGYLDPIYSCNICQDWGEINGNVCQCVRRLRIRELYQRSNLYDVLQNENFDTFRLDYYSQEPYEDKELTPYENAKRQLDQATNFVNNFDKEHDNLLIYGQTGLGKTFLSNCVAKSLLDKGHSVLYLSSNELFEEVLSNYIMSNNEKNRKTLEPIYEYIYNSDLLIIDDLGSEVLSSFVKSQLFEIVNKRIITSKSTLITTNLGLEALQDRYTERVMSRFADKYTLCLLYGDDIRYYGGRR